MNYIIRIFVLLLIGFGAYQTLLIFDDFSSQWPILALAIIYSATINDIFCHRICSHVMFDVDTSTTTYKILTFLASVDFGYGPNSTMLSMHQLHHTYADKGPYDPLNWRHHWTLTISLPFPNKGEWQAPDYAEYRHKRDTKYKNIIEDPWTVFCKEKQVPLAFAFLIVLYLISPALFSFFCISRFMLTLMSAFNGFCGHIERFPLSYRNFKTNDTTSNNLILHYLFLGYFAGMLQNNHHGRPKSDKPNQHWYEIDTSRPVVLLFKKLMERKVDK